LVEALVMPRTYKYEVTVDLKGKPHIEGIFDQEQDALARADYLLGLARYSAVRVLQVDDKDKEKVIFEKSAQGGGKNTSISAITEAAWCSGLPEVYGYPSRATLVRLMRKYCDEQSLIPCEVLHNYMLLRYLEREAGLFSGAIHRLAALQARRAGLKPEQRADQLNLLYRELVLAAKSADELKPQAAYLAQHGLSRFLNELETSLPEDQRPRALTYAVAHWLSEARDWGGKLQELCNLAEPEPSPAAVTALDQFLAETLDGTTPVRTVIGYAPDLVSALIAIGAVTLGQHNERLPGTPPLVALNQLMVRHPLPQTQAVLLAVITRALDGTAHLTRFGRGGDGQALRQLLPLLQEYGGFRGGPAMCAAVTRRAKMAFAFDGNDLPLEGAVDKVLSVLPGTADRIGYLLDLLTTDIGARKTTWLTAQLGQLFASLKSIRDFLPRPGDSVSSAGIAEHFRPRLFAGGIPTDLASRFLQRLELMARAEPDLCAGVIRAGKKAAAPWQEATTIEIGAPPPLPPATPVLALRYQDSRIDCSGHSKPQVVLGRSPECDLVVSFGGASRAHARISWSDGCFTLSDASRNGTWVQVGSRAPVVLKHESLVLDGDGVLFLGADPSLDQGPERHSIAFSLDQGEGGDFAAPPAAS